MYPDVALLRYSASELKNVLVFDPKYKRHDDAPVTADIDKMHSHRDAIHGQTGRRIVSCAAIIFPGESRDYAGEVRAISGIPGSERTETSVHLNTVSETVCRKVAVAIDQEAIPST